MIKPLNSIKMKKIFNYILAGGILSFSLTSCVDQLDQMPHIGTTSDDVYNSVDNYTSVLAKIYASYIMTGQEMGGGNSDMSSNTGQDYMRCYFNLQQLGTDEVASTWLEGDNIFDLSYLSWDANDPWVSDMYYRAYYTIAVANEFLRNSGDSKIASFSENDQVILRRYAAEARFLRALSYYHVLDLYRKGPFVTENDPVGAFIPPCYTAEQLFSFVESELKEVGELLPSKNETIYGHASRGAAYTLLAKLYLNGEVYTSTRYYDECIDAANLVIADGYSLESDYSKLFNADNHKRTNEIIFPFVVDSRTSVSWGSSTYIVCGAMGNTSDFLNPMDYGVAAGWGSFRVRGNIPTLFEEGDGRAMFFTQGQTQEVEVLDNQSNGYFVTKWTNLTDEGKPSSNTQSFGVDTDYPLFRLADVYLMVAESVARGSGKESRAKAAEYVNMLRERAYGDQSGNIAATELTEQLILNERARELYWEGTRRTDLIRYNMFTTNSYMWEWKGGVRNGRAVSNKFNYYPIPTSELSANPNMTNPEY